MATMTSQRRGVCSLGRLLFQHRLAVSSSAFGSGADAGGALAMTARSCFASSRTSSSSIKKTNKKSVASAAAATAAPSSSQGDDDAFVRVDATRDADGGEPFAGMPSVHPAVTAALNKLGYVAGTGIQSRAIPAVASGADVVVAAETGSGKTLSYLVPVWSNLLRHGHPTSVEGKTGRLGALILCPNATLCEQVAKVANSLVGDDGKPLLRTAALTPDTMLPYILPVRPLARPVPTSPHRPARDRF